MSWWWQPTEAAVAQTAAVSVTLTPAPVAVSTAVPAPTVTGEGLAIGLTPHPVVAWAAVPAPTLTVAELPFVPVVHVAGGGELAGSGSMIVGVPMTDSQLALEAHYLRDGASCDRFAGLNGPLAFEATGDPALVGRLHIPNYGLLEPVTGPTRCGTAYVAMRALGRGRLKIGFEAAASGVALGLVHMAWTLRVSGRLAFWRDEISDGGLRYWSIAIGEGLVDWNCVINVHPGRLLPCNLSTSHIEIEVRAGDLITAGLEYVAGSIPAFFACDPTSGGSPMTFGHLWAAGPLGNEALVMSGSGAPADSL